MRTATAAATFHKARYQNSLIAGTTAASLRTRRLAAAAASTTFLPSAPTVATPTGAPTTATATGTSAATTTVNKQTQEQQQTSNKTWPPGSSFASCCCRVAATTTNIAPTADTFACNPAEGNSKYKHNRYQSSSEEPKLRASEQINLLPDPIANTENHQKSVTLLAGAYKRVHLPASNQHSDGTRQDTQNSRGQSVESLAAQASETETAPLVQGPLHLAQARFEYRQATPHEYQELTNHPVALADIDDQEFERREPQAKPNQLDISAALAAIIKQNHENQLQVAQKQPKQPIKPSTDKKKPKNLTMATLRPISPQYQHTLDSAISLSKELASKNMADSGESSPKTPNSPDKKRFNFKLKHFSKSYSEASANIRDIESSISDEAKLAYKSLVERGQFNSSHQPFGCDGGRSFNNYRNNSPNGLRDLYANEDFHSPTTPPATTSKFKYSTFSVKKTFF